MAGVVPEVEAWTVDGTPADCIAIAMDKHVQNVPHHTYEELSGIVATRMGRHGFVRLRATRTHCPQRESRNLRARIAAVRARVSASVSISVLVPRANEDTHRRRPRSVRCDTSATQCAGCVVRL